MHVLLAFHYSDDWADPYSQDVPSEWLGIVDDTTELGNALYTYTTAVLDELNNLSLMPDFVQVGNEINAMILQRPNVLEPIYWERNQFQINIGIKAVRDVSSKTGQDIHVMLHIAQPENALTWFKDATKMVFQTLTTLGFHTTPNGRRKI
jgi:arabinogalactan endo-1,4-beta-galactosidase